MVAGESTREARWKAGVPAALVCCSGAFGFESPGRRRRWAERLTKGWSHIPDLIMKSIKRLLLILTIGATVAVLALGSAALISKGVAWRFIILKEKLTGKIPEIPFLTLLRWMRPGSPVYLGELSEMPNVNASISTLFNDRHSAEAGARFYGRECGGCHGENLRGRTGPNLLAALGNLTDWSFFSTVKWGRRGTVMIAQKLSDLEIWQVYAYARQMSMEEAIGRKSSSKEIRPFPAVTVEMLGEGNRSGDWLMYAGNYAGYRHGLQHQISRQNVQQLRLAWAAQLRADSPSLEATPIVTQGRVFVTQSPEGVTALDASTGATLWEFRRPVPPDIPLCCGAQNRGVAVLGNTLFVATLDAHLVALDATTGAKHWDAKVADWHDGYSMTGAPLAVEDRVVVGVAGGDFGIRGFIAAYSAKDGTLQWKFDTVPGPGQAGHETWPGNSWEHGGTATWTTGSYDSTLGLIYWGTGNPAPVYNSEARPGLNLYANSVVAVDARSGRLRWYFQFTPSDAHDWDATQQPVLADIQWLGQLRPALLVSNRNGFFYALDRQAGKFLFAKPFAKQTWASGFTDDGHPIVRPGLSPSRDGTLIWPSAAGATNWWPPSFDPQRRLLFVPSVDAASIYFRDQFPQFHQGSPFAGSTYQRAPNQPISIAIRAVDVTTGDLRWDAPIATGGSEMRAGDMGGLLSTEGDLVFGGYGAEFFALDSDTGKKIWTTPLGAVVHAPPITFVLAGHQYIVVIAGRTLFAFALPLTQESMNGHASVPKINSPRR